MGEVDGGDCKRAGRLSVLPAWLLPQLADLRGAHLQLRILIEK